MTQARHEALGLREEEVTKPLRTHMAGSRVLWLNRGHRSLRRMEIVTHGMVRMTDHGGLTASDLTKTDACSFIEEPRDPASRDADGGNMYHT